MRVRASRPAAGPCSSSGDSPATCTGITCVYHQYQSYLSMYGCMSCEWCPPADTHTAGAPHGPRPSYTMVPDPDTSPSDTEVVHYWLCTTRCAVHGGVPPLRAAAPSPDPGLVLGPAARQLPSSARPARRARLPADGRAPATPVHTVASGLTIRRPRARRARRQAGGGGGGRRQPSRPSDHTCFRNTNSALVTDLKKNEASAVRKNCAPDAPADGDKSPVTRWPQDRWTELHGLSYMDVYGAKC